MSEKPKLTGGYARLLEQMVQHVTEEVECLPEDAIGDSPIEKLLYSALRAYVYLGASEYQQAFVPSDAAMLARTLERRDPLTLVIQPQVQLEGWRVDFLISAMDFGRATGREQWRRLIVECDGHEFHERTKEQAKRDRSRDRQAQLLGMSVMRFTGHEIHTDPLGCAQQISEWGAMGW